MLTESKNDPVYRDNAITFKRPIAEDGIEVHRLIQKCQPLDENSVYCNLLQCTHFSDTSVAAWADGKLIGFISGYLRPDQKETLFIWQVAVSPEARGQKLARRMLQHLLTRPGSASIRFVEATITPNNEASWKLFHSLARQYNAKTQREILFESQRHFSGLHEEEHLIRVGPFPN